MTESKPHPYQCIDEANDEITAVNLVASVGSPAYGLAEFLTSKDDPAIIIRFSVGSQQLTLDMSMSTNIALYAAIAHRKRVQRLLLDRTTRKPSVVASIKRITKRDAICVDFLDPPSRRIIMHLELCNPCACALYSAIMWNMPIEDQDGDVDKFL